MSKATRVALIVGAAPISLVVLGWVGLQVQPPSFPSYGEATQDMELMPLPEGLPPPVERFYRALYGEDLPVIQSAVISGRAKMRLGGVTVPGRFRFVHDAGQGYRHYIEATLYGLPLLKVNEHYLESKSRLELPFGVVEGKPRVDQAANLGLWAESVWLPTVWLTDPRVRWEPVDESQARLVVPFGETEERLIARFDSERGLLHSMEGLRYKDANSGARTPWLTEALAWDRLNGGMTLTEAAVTWLDDGRPWAVFTVEEVVYNADVREYIRAKGP